MGELKKDTILESIVYKKNNGGPTLGYSLDSGVKLLKQDGLFFKDLDKDGKLSKYEDWRLDPEERAKDPGLQNDT